MEGDDLYLQALALKFLYLQSQDPTRLMNALSTLQLDLQGDMEGYLGTCLARYLVPQGQNEADEKELLRNFEPLDNATGCSYLPSVINPSFIWARDVICTYIWAKATGYETVTPGWAIHLRIYGSRLPQYVATFIEEKFRLKIPPPMRVPFNIIDNKNEQQDSAYASRRLSDPPYMPHVHDREDRRRGPSSPFLDRTGKSKVTSRVAIRDGHDRDYDSSSSYNSSSSDTIVHQNSPPKYCDERDRQHRAEPERLRARAAGLKKQTEMRKGLEKGKRKEVKQDPKRQWLDQKNLTSMMRRLEKG